MSQSYVLHMENEIENVITNENRKRGVWGEKPQFLSRKQLTEGSFSVSENNLPVAKIRITFAPSLTYYTK